MLGRRVVGVEAYVATDRVFEAGFRPSLQLVVSAFAFSRARLKFRNDNSISRRNLRVQGHVCLNLRFLYIFYP